MIKAIQCKVNEHAFCPITDIDQASDIKDDPNSLLWLDLQNPTEADLAKIKEEFDLHPLAIEDATHEHQRPKIEEYDSFYFIVFYVLQFGYGIQNLNIIELDIFLGKNYLITVHHHPLEELTEVEMRWKRNEHQLQKGVGTLLYSLLDTIVDRYFPIVDGLVEKAEELEDRMFMEVKRRSALTLQVLNLKKELLQLRRIVVPERDIMNVLTNRDNPTFNEHVNLYFRDIYDHISRLADTLDLYRDQLASIMDANLSIQSNDLNKVMRTMTAASIILMADSLIAGIYGMNFVNMPELQLKYGYFLVLGIILVLSFLMYLFFRRLKWL